MDSETISRLLASIYAGRLVLVCGAGLSMSAPSSLPPAWQVAQQCFDTYRLKIDPGADVMMRHDLEVLAQHFADMGTLESVFIHGLVPWTVFRRPPNAGHAAVADFLVTRAAAAGLSANYDFLIEQCAISNGFDFQNALDGEEATLQARLQSPLLKIHGCATRDRSSTVWAASQLQTGIVSERITKSRDWMTANLRQKDLLVVGFWTDWEYLNGILGGVLQGATPSSITVIDPSDAGALEAKAPQLWALAHSGDVIFRHVQGQGAPALEALRLAFSKSYLRAVLAAGQAAYEDISGALCDPDWLEAPDFDAETLYALRRDAEGVPAGHPATRREPDQGELLGMFHLLLKSQGATPTAEGYTLNGRSIRVVNGAQQVLSRLRSRFIEAPVAMQADVVVAVGANDWPLPGNVVRSGRDGDFMRAAPTGAWFDTAGARAELGI